MREIEHILVPAEQIILLEENPRDIENKDLEKLVEDIRTDRDFFYQRPPLVNLKNGKYYCYAGTQRVKAAIKLGLSEIYCFVEKDVPKKVQEKRMLSDNLHRGKWNREKLLDLDFDLMELKDFGFEDIELDIFGEEPEYPDDLTAPKKDNPPTIKITFTDTKQMNKFEKQLNEVLKTYDGAIYSVSQGEI